MRRPRPNRTEYRPPSRTVPKFAGRPVPTMPARAMAQTRAVMPGNPGPTSRCVREGRVGSGDHQEDPRLVQAAQEGPGRRHAADCRSRRTQHADQGRAANTGGEDEARFVRREGPLDQPGRAAAGQGDGDDMEPVIRGSLQGVRIVLHEVFIGDVGRHHDLRRRSPCGSRRPSHFRMSLSRSEAARPGSPPPLRRTVGCRRRADGGSGLHAHQATSSPDVTPFFPTMVLRNGQAR